MHEITCEICLFTKIFKNQAFVLLLFPFSPQNQCVHYRDLNFVRVITRNVSAIQRVCYEGLTGIQSFPRKSVPITRCQLYMISAIKNFDFISFITLNSCIKFRFNVALISEIYSIFDEKQGDKSSNHNRVQMRMK